MPPKSTLDLLNECDNFPYFDDLKQEQEGLADYYKFKLHGCSAVLGQIPASVAARFPLTANWERHEKAREFVFRPQDVPSKPEEALIYRNKILAEYLLELRKQKTFKVLSGWRNELYPIYGPNRQLLLNMERSATPLFGVVSYGVHMTAYVNSPEGMKIWTPRRSETKQTFPGMMDNTVAGGLSTGEKPSECLVRESMEEASLPENVVRRARACGTLTYHYVRGANAGGEVGLSQPEIQYLYDLELPADVVPKPNDDEAIDFKALTIQEIRQALAAGRFKPNCALVLIEFFVRHGILTAENEPDYIEVVARLHRRLAFPTA